MNGVPEKDRDGRTGTALNRPGLAWNCLEAGSVFGPSHAFRKYLTENTVWLVSDVWGCRGVDSVLKRRSGVGYSECVLVPSEGTLVPSEGEPVPRSGNSVPSPLRRRDPWRRRDHRRRRDRRDHRRRRDRRARRAPSSYARPVRSVQAARDLAVREVRGTGPSAERRANATEGSETTPGGRGRRSRSAVPTISCICAKVPPHSPETNSSGSNTEVSL